MATRKKAKYKLDLPKGYKRKPLPWFKEWVTALESGKYRQGIEQLVARKNSGHLGYCCLGVLSKVQGRLVKIEDDYVDKIRDQSSDLEKSNPCFSALNSNGTFPTDVVVRYQANDEKDTKEFSLSAPSLISCNDDAELSFKQIAAIIRKVWKA